MTKPLPKYYTIEEFAKLLHITKETAWLIVRSGEIEIIRLPGTKELIRISRKAIDDYITRGTIPKQGGMS